MPGSRRAGLLAVLALCVCAACTTGGPRAPVFPSGQIRAELQIDAQDNGRTVGIQTGEVFVLTLTEADPDWTVAQQPDPSVLVLVSRTRKGATDVWTFRGAGPGTTELELTSGAPEPFSLIVSVT